MAVAEYAGETEDVSNVIETAQVSEELLLVSLVGDLADLGTYFGD